MDCNYRYPISFLLEASGNKRSMSLHADNAEDDLSISLAQQAVAAQQSHTAACKYSYTDGLTLQIAMHLFAYRDAAATRAGIHDCTPTKRGDYTMISSLVKFGGLTATVYTSAWSIGSPTTFINRLTTLLQNNVVDFSVAANANLPASSAGLGTLRWQGFVQPGKAAQYTFYVAVKTDAAETCHVWIDNNLVITRVAGAATEVSATFGFGLANSLYDIDVIYAASANNVERGVSLTWESLGSIDPVNNAVKSVVPSTALWSRHDVENVDIPNGDASSAKNWMFTTSTDAIERKLFVRPAVGCASMSTAIGKALTLATAGLPATFTIFSKDMWQNSRSIQSDMVWVGTAFGFLAVVAYRQFLPQLPISKRALSPDFRHPHSQPPPRMG
jgi:hypothetical protein